jgi:hypothetical protein
MYMEPEKFTAEDFTECRRLWLAGKCPCCGAELDSWINSNHETIQPEAIAEGVMMCGRCIGNEHHIRPEGFLEMLLKSLLP